MAGETMLYDVIKDKIQAPFPSGTVQVKDKKKMAYIPAQVYMSRLEEVAGAMWNWSVKSVEIKESHIVVIGTLHIAEVSRDGIGFSNFSEQNYIKSSLSSAESEAFRNACDKYKMGWNDLAPYREWGDNPGLDLNERIVPKPENVSIKICIVCKKKLDPADDLMLELHNIRQNYCTDHIPSYLLKKERK